MMMAETEPRANPPDSELRTQSAAPPQFPPPTSSAQKSIVYKNRLQEYALRSYLPLPTYKTFSEGHPYAPKFGANVYVAGELYSSQNTFFQAKAAEQDAARVALERIIEKIKNEKFPIVYEDPVFCKSILNEFAAKMNLWLPTYDTVASGEKIASFRSSLVFNGVTYTGDCARTKKVAEQLGARAAILSLLGNPAYLMYLSEIINSKAKIYSRPSQVKDLCNDEHGLQPAEVKVKVDQIEHAVITHQALTDSTSEAHPLKQLSCQIEHAAITHQALTDSTSKAHPLKQLSCHEFFLPRSEQLSDQISLPVPFVPSVAEQPFDVLENNGRKRNKKNKKKANKKLRTDVLPAGATPTPR